MRNLWMGLIVLLGLWLTPSSAVATQDGFAPFWLTPTGAWIFFPYSSSQPLPTTPPPAIPPPIVVPPSPTPTPTPSPIPAPVNPTIPGDWVQRELTQLNAFRAANGAGPLRLNTALIQSAQKYATYMGTAKFFAHNGLDGSTPPMRMQKAGAVGTGWWGENIAAGQSTVESVMLAWENSPGHRANMVNPNFTDIGIGIDYVPGSPYGYYWVQDFLQTAGR